jgi:hypothetical protein
MRDRRHVLSTMLANFLSLAYRLPLGVKLAGPTTILGIHQALASRPPPSPTVDSLLGEYVVTGTTGRLCIFGKNFHDVETIFFQESTIATRFIALSDNELIVDITIPDYIGPGKLKFVIRTKSGQSYPGGDITIIIERLSAYSAGAGLPTVTTSPGMPPPETGTPAGPAGKETPVHPGKNSNAIEQYYKNRHPVVGIGGSLL